MIFWFYYLIFISWLSSLDKSFSSFSLIKKKNFIFWPQHVACGVLVPQLQIEPVSPALEAQSVNHWTSREVPSYFLFLWVSVDSWIFIYSKFYSISVVNFDIQIVLNQAHNSPCKLFPAVSFWQDSISLWVFPFWHKCPQLTLYLLCPGPGINYFLQGVLDFIPLTLGVPTYCFLSDIAPRLFEGKEVDQKNFLKEIIIS